MWVLFILSMESNKTPYTEKFVDFTGFDELLNSA